MKILFSNLVLDSTISCSHLNTSYPVDNLKHAFLKKVWKSASSTDELVFAWSADQSISSIFVSLTNATALRLRLYDGSSSLLKDVSFSPSLGVLYFDAISGVRTARLSLSGTPGGAAVYLGKAGLGVAFELPAPLNDWIPARKDNSIKSYSSGGQVLTDHVKPLKKMGFNFFTRSYAEYTEIVDLCSAVSQPVFFDFTNKKHSFQAPFYADLSTNFDNPGRDDRIFLFSLTLTEAN